MIAVSGLPRLQNPAELHSQEVASQLSHHPSRQLATMESNLGFNKSLNHRLVKDSLSAIVKNNGISSISD